MQIQFAKMHGQGNDFMVIEGLTQTVSIAPEQVKLWGDRHCGVGFDQLLLALPPTDPKADFLYRIYNANGEEVTQCGNGARCIAQYLYDQNLIRKQQFYAQTNHQPLELNIKAKGQVRVDMGIPQFTPAEIPLDMAQEALTYPLELTSQSTLYIGAVSMGNPHALLIVDDVVKTNIENLGQQIEQHPKFPQKTNVSFIQIKNNNHITMRVYERGVGPTLSCGSAACAAVAWGIRADKLDASNAIKVTMPGGDVSISQTPQGSIQLTGPTTTVFHGSITI